MSLYTYEYTGHIINIYILYILYGERSLISHSLWLWMDTSSICCNVALTQCWEQPEGASTLQNLAMTPIKE